MLWLWAILLLVILIACWSLNIVGLPGNWINVVAVGIYAWLMPLEHRADIGWVIFAILVFLAAMGEIFEFAAGSAGAATAGGSKRGAALAVFGAIIGAIVGLFVGLPIPIFGLIIASLLFSAIGALLGAMLGEKWKGKSLEESFWVGHAAFWGRLFGTVGKIIAGGLMIIIAAFGIAIHRI